MLGKLIKHEFKATSKMMGLLLGSMMLLTILTRVMGILPSENEVIAVVKGIVMFIYIVAVMAVSAIALVLLLNRFYNNMLKDQGYLTHTLPVKMWQQIAAKIITYSVWIFATIIVLMISIFVMTVGELFPFGGFTEFCMEVGAALVENPTLIPLLLLGIVLVFLSGACNILMFTAAMSLGQLFGRHRVAGAVACYFIMNYAISIVGTIVMFAVTPLMESVIEKMAANYEMLTVEQEIFNYTISIGYLAVFGMIVLQILMSALYYVITHYMLTKKLNLE